MNLHKISNDEILIPFQQRAIRCGGHRPSQNGGHTRRGEVGMRLNERVSCRPSQRAHSYDTKCVTPAKRRIHRATWTSPSRCHPSRCPEASIPSHGRNRAGACHRAPTRRTTCPGLSGSRSSSSADADRSRRGGSERVSRRSHEKGAMDDGRSRKRMLWDKPMVFFLARAAPD